MQEKTMIEQMALCRLFEFSSYVSKCIADEFSELTVWKLQYAPFKDWRDVQTYIKNQVWKETLREAAIARRRRRRQCGEW